MAMGNATVATANATTAAALPATAQQFAFGAGFELPSRTVQMWAGGIAFAVGLVCLCVDSLVAGIMLRMGLLANSQFAMLYLNMVIAECVDMAICTFWMAPIIFFDATELGNTLVSRKLGHTIIAGWSAILYTMIIIAINRYVAIVQPMRYKTIFTQRRCVTLLVVCWIFAIVNTFGYFYPAEGCDFYPSPAMLGWAYLDTTCGWVLNWHCVAACSPGIVVLVTLNGLTLREMHRRNKAVAPVSPDAGGHTKSTAATIDYERRRKGEIRLFTQAALNATIVEGTVVSFHVVSLLFPSPVGYFIFATIPFVVAHGSNGFIMLALYPELRKRIRHMLAC